MGKGFSSLKVVEMQAFRVVPSENGFVRNAGTLDNSVGKRQILSRPSGHDLGEPEGCFDGNSPLHLENNLLYNTEDAMKKMFVMALLLCFLATAFGCAENRAQQGASMGGLAGATIGALTFNDKLLGAVVGAGVGTLMGYIVGNEWDKHDEAHVQQALEKGRSDESVQWTNPDSGAQYSATPKPPYMEDHRVYRDVVIRDEKDGNTVMAKAWRDDKGIWHLKQ